MEVVVVVSTHVDARARTIQTNYAHKGVRGGS